MGHSPHHWLLGSYVGRLEKAAYSSTLHTHILAVAAWLALGSWVNTSSGPLVSFSCVEVQIPLAATTCWVFILQEAQVQWFQLKTFILLSLCKFPKSY